MSNIASNKLGTNGGRSYSFLNRPVTIDCNFIVDSTNGNGLGIRSLKGAGVQAVYMNTSAPLAGSGNPNPAAGYALIQLSNNYNRYSGGFAGLVAPTTGNDLAINATALTPGNPYIITSVGVPTAGTVTIAPVADVSGSLASTYFSIYDGYGNTYIVWFSVSGIGKAPSNVSGTLVQQSISTGATAAQVGAALVITLENLLAAQPGNLTAPASVNSFTASGSTTVTVVSTLSAPLPGGPAEGAIATGFTFAVTASNSNTKNWLAVGLPAGVEPSVGAAFIATAAGQASNGTSSGTVRAVGVANIQNVQVIGDPNQSIAPIPRGGSPNVGGYILVQFLSASNAVAAPTDGDVVGLSFIVEAGSSLVAGE
jgi:hypothetical protein